MSLVIEFFKKTVYIFYGSEGPGFFYSFYYQLYEGLGHSPFHCCHPKPSILIVRDYSTKELWIVASFSTLFAEH